MTALKLLEPFRTNHIPVIGFVNECRNSEALREALALWIAAGADLGNRTYLPRGSELDATRRRISPTSSTAKR